MARASKSGWRRLAELAALSASGSAAAAAALLWRGDDRFYSTVAVPAAHRFCGRGDAERAHRLAVALAARGWVRPGRLEQERQKPLLRTRVFGLDFPNPVGLAAGFDKDGEAAAGMCGAGFGSVEVGSVTPRPQPGNGAPRVFRLGQDAAVINRYGFNSAGHAAVHERLRDFHSSSGGVILGVNLGKNKSSADAVADYVEGVRRFADVADYLVINVSSPNTPGLRALQGREELESLIAPVLAERDRISAIKGGDLPGDEGIKRGKGRPPVLLKVAPDLTDADKRDIAQVITSDKCRVDGLIVSNTTVTRPAGLESEHQSERGGLSGRPLKEASTAAIRDFYNLTGGTVPIVGVGGVEDGASALEKLEAGASLVQLYTSMVFHGPPVVARVRRELAAELERRGCRGVAEVVGSKADERRE